MSPLVPLTTVHGAFSAHVLAARLHSEGIDVELRGSVGAPYGLTVGDMARVDLFVPEAQIDDARLVLLASEIDAAMELLDDEESGDEPRDELRSHTRAPRAWLWVLTGVFVLAAVAALLLRSLVG